VNPLWLFVGRVGTLLGVTLSLKSLRETHQRELREIQPHRIYNSREAAALLGVERIEMVEKLKKKQIRGRLVNGNYRIPGASLLDYLQQEEVV
jgi:predicted transcriptional regulator of viral defense system